MLKLILETLRETPFPKCRTRKNVSDSSYSGFCLGEVNYRGQRNLGGLSRGPSRFNAKFSHLHSLLMQYISRERPKFQYTTIQVNKGIQCKPHIDSNNVGPSYIIALGEFEGGELVLEGKKIDIKNKLRKIDGRLGHWTNPFKGERYSIVFFTHTFKPPNYWLRRTVVTKRGLIINGIFLKKY